MKKYAYNPILPLDKYIPDGEPHVFDGRVYLFGSHDREGGNTFCELDYEFFSAPIDDLSNWSSNGINYCSKQDALYTNERPYMYAPDVVRGNDGKYYLYYCLAGEKGSGGYNGPVSVAVCDKPDGKYEYLGYVKNRDGTPFNKYVCFDPAVINDGGVIRLYYGTSMPMGVCLPRFVRKIASTALGKTYGKSRAEITAEPGVWGANMVTLCDDMQTVESDAVRIIPEKTKGTSFENHAFFEGSSIRKINGMYYFIYSSQKNHELCYAVSKEPDRNFEYGGTIVSTGDVGFDGRKEKDRLNVTGTTHGSIEFINGRWYVFYHRLTHASDYSRQACAEPIKINEDSSICQVEISSSGLEAKPLLASGIYPAVIACNITNGRMPHISNRRYNGNIPKITDCRGERYIADIDRRTAVCYKWFDFVSDTGEIILDIDSHADGKIVVFANRIPIASAAITSCGRSKIIMQYKVHDANSQTLSINFSGKGTFDLYTIEFKE